MPSPKDTVETILAGAVRQVAPGVDISLRLELPRNPDHGDYATSVALQLAKPLARKPREIAEEIVRKSRTDVEKSGASLEIAGAGFINIRLKNTAKQAVVAEVLKQGARYGRGSA